MPPNTHHDTNAEVPLVVDVDGTLVRGDLLLEGAIRLLAASPCTLFAWPLWLARGRARLKRRVAEAMPLPVEELALEPHVLAEIERAKAAGREVYLASAADAGVVAPLVDAVGAAGFLASDGRVNLAGRAKAAALVERFGERGFDYIGDARRDLAVWRHARRAIGVNLSAGMRRAVRAVDAQARFLAGDGTALDYLRALRPHQWIKNALVFAPLVADHATRVDLYLAVAGVFVAFSMCASGGYVFNDLVDLPRDRRHPRKRRRPLAAGTVRLAPMAELGVVLMTAGVGVGVALSPATGWWMALYAAATVAYSLRLKFLLFADVVTLAVLYTMRVLAGAAAVSIVPSGWFLVFSVFLFLALALVKRQAELHAAPGDRLDHADSLRGRHYRTEDRAPLAALNAAAGFVSVMVLMLYSQSTEVAGRYTRPEWLWLMTPVLLYYLGRLSVLAHRGAVGDDPVAFILRDRAGYVCVLALLAAFAAAV